MLAQYTDLCLYGHVGVIYICEITFIANIKKINHSLNKLVCVFIQYTANKNIKEVL